MGREAKLRQERKQVKNLKPEDFSVMVEHLMLQMFPANEDKDLREFLHRYYIDEDFRIAVTPTLNEILAESIGEVLAGNHMIKQ